jgi:very-short-patch-repair endonuclease
MAQNFKTAEALLYGVLKENAKHNRQEMTASETALWYALRKEFQGVKFRRQHPIGEYIADFLCVTHKLVIEVDGGYHNVLSQQENDRQRTEFLEQTGYTVIRFTNEEVNAELKSVIIKIKEELLKIEENYE